MAGLISAGEILLKAGSSAECSKGFITLVCPQLLGVKARHYGQVADYSQGQYNEPMADTPVKRFIAGAVCPACSKMDKLRMYTEGDRQHRECVSCGYADVMDQSGNIVELGTRVNQPRPGEDVLAHEEEVQVLSLDPKGSPTLH